MTSLEGKSPIQEKMNLLQAASGNADPSPTPLVLPGWFLGKYNPVLIGDGEDIICPEPCFES